MASTFDEIRADLAAQQLAAEEQGARVAARYHELLLRVLREFRAQFFPRDALFGPLVFHDRILWGIGRFEEDRSVIQAPITVTLSWRPWDDEADMDVSFQVGVPDYGGTIWTLEEERLREQLPEALKWRQ